MKLNEIQLMAVNISKKFRDILGNRISSTKIYDVVDVPDHHSFKIKFVAYNYFSIVFQYELDIIGCHIEYGNDVCIPLTSDKHCLSDTDIEHYILDLKDEIELRIPTEVGGSEVVAVEQKNKLSKQ